jgi:hypothetical protein
MLTSHTEEQNQAQFEAEKHILIQIETPSGSPVGSEGEPELRRGSTPATRAGEMQIDTPSTVASSPESPASLDSLEASISTLASSPVLFASLPLNSPQPQKHSQFHSLRAQFEPSDNLPHTLTAMEPLRMRIIYALLEAAKWQQEHSEEHLQEHDGKAGKIAMLLEILQSQATVLPPTQTDAELKGSAPRKQGGHYFRWGLAALGIVMALSLAWRRRGRGVQQLHRLHLHLRTTRHPMPILLSYLQ